MKKKRKKTSTKNPLFLAVKKQGTFLCISLFIILSITLTQQHKSINITQNEPKCQILLFSTKPTHTPANH